MLLPRSEWPTIPGYKLIDVLGGGGYGFVFLAEEESLLQKKCAIKVCWPSPLLSEEGVEERFKRESKTLADLNHPQVTSYMRSGFLDGETRRPYLVMSYVDGRDLHSESLPLPVDRACEIVLSVLDTLEYCHTHDVIHRDLKPGNIVMRSIDATPVLVDFGLSISIAASVERVTKGAAGTPGYMAPELIADWKIRNVKLDLYSMGIVFYELLAGRLPDPLDPAPLGSVRSELDTSIDELIRSCVAPAANRLPTAKHFKERLSAWRDLHRERVTHAAKLSARGLGWRQGLLDVRRRRLSDAKATATAAAQMAQIAETQAAAITTKALLFFEELVEAVKGEIPALSLMAADGLHTSGVTGILAGSPKDGSVFDLMAIEAGVNRLAFAVSWQPDLSHPTTHEPLFRAPGKGEAVVADLQRVPPRSPRIMQPVFFVYSQEESDTAKRWFHLAMIMVFEDADYWDSAALRFVVEHHPKYVKMDDRLVVCNSPDAVQEEVGRVVDWFVNNVLSRII